MVTNTINFTKAEKQALIERWRDEVGKNAKAIGINERKNDKHGVEIGKNREK